MGKVTDIPNEDNILRWIKNKHLERSVDGKEVIGLFHGAFRLREGESYLSVNWIEFFDRNEKQKLSKTVDDFRNGLNNRRLSPKSLFAKLNVETFKKTCLQHAAKVRILHEPDKIKSHTAIRQLPQDNALLFDDICNLAFDFLIPAENFLD